MDQPAHTATSVHTVTEPTGWRAGGLPPEQPSIEWTAAGCGTPRLQQRPCAAVAFSRPGASNAESQGSRAVAREVGSGRPEKGRDPQKPSRAAEGRDPGVSSRGRI